MRQEQLKVVLAEGADVDSVMEALSMVEGVYRVVHGFDRWAQDGRSYLLVPKTDRGEAPE